MADHSRMKLGRLPRKHDPHVPCFASYIAKATRNIAPPPAAVDWVSKIPVNGWPMMSNQQYGCCAFAAIGHIREQQTYYASGTAQIPTDAEILSWYAQVTGFNPNDPSTDKGTVLTDALAAWLRGFPTAPGKVEQLQAYCYVNPQNTTEVKRSIYWLGALYIGLNMPVAWQTADVWSTNQQNPNDPHYAPGSWGGHCVPVMAYSETDLTCITWGRTMKISWAALRTYCDEAFAVLTKDWQKPPGVTPAGIAWTNIIADMDVIRSGG